MKKSKKLDIFLLLLSCLISTTGRSADGGEKKFLTQPLAPGYNTLKYPVPQPGSYQLPTIGMAADGVVLNADGKQTSLHQLMGDKVVLLSFIYSTCSDINGCPLATSVFHKIKRRLQEEPGLSKQFRLLTLSFDPQHDTPERMKQYGKGFQGTGIEWQFLTTASEQTLNPILQQYQQNIQKQYDPQGKFLGTFSHLLRVYLIDRNKQLRNIYSVAFLHADTLINDVKTLLLSQSATAESINELPEHKLDRASRIYAAGDNKAGYDESAYQTQSIALADRTGRPIDLLQYVQTPPLGLPALPIPENNPLTTAKINLGKQLFYDRRLSLNNTFSCAMCHIPEQGFTSNEMQTAVGIEGRTVRRNSPTIYNVGYYKTLFHDGRETSLEQQVWAPLLAHNEMGNPSIGYVIEKIKTLADYKNNFTQVFGRGPSMETIGMAIASYERTLISANSAFDRWYYGKQQHAISNAAKKGFKLFTGKAGCAQCHSISSEYALFSDNNFHNTGIGYAEAMDIQPAKQRVQIAPGTYIDIDRDIITALSGSKTNDLGRYEVSQNPEDRWKYKTPSLRNISLTAPYMHNGQFETLKQVLEFYNQGGKANENLDLKINSLHLSEQEIHELEVFLLSLTGDNVAHLVADAYTANIGDPE